jgi:hypothetical protein
MQNRGQDIKASSLQDTLMTKESKTEETPPLTSIYSSLDAHQPSPTQRNTLNDIKQKHGNHTAIRA